MPFGCYISSKSEDQKLIAKYTWPIGKTRKDEKAKLVFTAAVENKATRKRAIGVQLDCKKCKFQMTCQVNPNTEKTFHPRG